MEFVPIFGADMSDEGLWSIKFAGKIRSEFDLFFDMVNDVERLYNFFGHNKADLNNGFFGSITVGAAVSRTRDEAEEMENLLYDYSKRDLEGNDESLQHLFKPLNNFEYAIVTHQKSKAKVRNGWLRLYAIRLAEDCYVVTGGAIKLTLDMKRGHLQQELKKLELARQFLRNNGIDYPEDLNS
jgi:hypothetical protein